MTFIFVVLGYRGTHGWPGMYCAMNPMSRTDFEGQMIKACRLPCDDDAGMTKEDPKRERDSVLTSLNQSESVAFFLRRGTDPMNITFLPDCNAAPGKDFKEFCSYAALCAHMGWDEAAASSRNHKKVKTQLIVD
jgi:hypothetical protein